MKQIILFLAALLLCMTHAAAGEPIGTATTVAGTVFLNPDSGSTRLAQGDALRGKDVIATGEDGRATIELNDGSQLMIDANSKLALSAYDISGEPEGIFDLTRGRLRSVVTDTFSSKRNSFKVRTGTSVMGVQGTDFLAIADAIVTFIYVVQGSVQVTNINPDIIGAVILQAGQSTEVRKDQPPTDPVDEPSPPGSGGVLDLRSGGSQGNDPLLMTPELGTADESRRIRPPTNQLQDSLFFRGQ
jgi:ferric-dicitrate binding protein FerR (iron transport regulator)